MPAGVSDGFAGGSISRTRRCGNAPPGNRRARRQRIDGGLEQDGADPALARRELQAAALGEVGPRSFGEHCGKGRTAYGFFQRPKRIDRPARANRRHLCWIKSEPGQ